LVVTVLAGCRFDHAAALGDATVSSDMRDAPDDVSTNATCSDKWLAGTIHFGAAQLIANVNDSGTYDRDPFLPADELTIYFSTGRAGNAKVFMASRANIASSFGTPQEASPFTSTSNDTKLSIASNGLIAVVGSDRPGGLGGIDVWESIRTSTTQQWPAMNRTNVMMVDSAGNDQDPTLSADGQHLYFAPDLPSPQHIAVSTRGGDGRFGPPVPLPQLDSAAGDADPSPTPDERVLAFASNRSGNGDMYYATRAMSNIGFSAAALIPDVNTTGAEGDPHLSADGCRLYFARAVTGYQYDLYVATAQ
jgi:hypothetical protein